MIDHFEFQLVFRRPLLVALAAALGLVASAQANVQFNEIARFSLGETADSEGASFIGSNPSALAWNGSKLYVAGFNNTNMTGTVAIVEVLDATATGIHATPTLGSAFSQLTTPDTGFRGFSGLAISEDTLVATYDHGAVHPAGLQAFNTGDNTLRWTKDIRGFTGPAFDPGFPGGDPALGSGVAWSTSGSGRRGLVDTATGTDIHPLTMGMIWIQLPLPDQFTFPRDIDFDIETGDIYVRRSNDVHVATRTGDNTANDQRFLVDNGANGAFVSGQNLAFLSNTVVGDLIIYNDRPDTTHGGPFEGRLFLDTIKVVDKDGGPQAAIFRMLGGLTGADIGPGVGWYDFSYHAPTQTLALLDFWNRNVFIFEVAEPTPPIVGDYNANGVVDAADYTVWRDNLGTINPLPNDPVGGVIGQEQYDNWKANFGSAAGAGGALASAAVPEPSGVLLLLVAAASLALARRQ